MFRIIMSIVFVVVVGAAYWISNSSDSEKEPTVEQTQQPQQQGSNFNNL